MGSSDGIRALIFWVIGNRMLRIFKSITRGLAAIWSGGVVDLHVILGMGEESTARHWQCRAMRDVQR